MNGYLNAVTPAPPHHYFATKITGVPVDSCYADCDHNGTLNIADFLCFIEEFAQGCP